MNRIYLDYAAATPVDSAVRAAMEPYFAEKFGNPGSVHVFGQEAIAALDHSREVIAKSVGAEFRQIIFTSSATEANNIAIRGAVAKFKEERFRASGDGNVVQILVSAIEHESVLEAARDLERYGVKIVYVPVTKEGIVDTSFIKENLTLDTALVSIMYANNEIGAVQPIAEIAQIVKDFRGKSAYPLFHADAAQAFQYFDCGVSTLSVDLITISSHKIYGPKGAGALFAKDVAHLTPLVLGGGQEYGLRSGTENVPAVVGFAKAVEMAQAMRTEEATRVGKLRDPLWQGIKEIFPKAEINGAPENDDSKNNAAKLPNILNVYFPGYAAQDLLTRFDLEGVAASSGSACRSRAIQSSYVIEALGYDKARAKESVRFSLGRQTTKEEIDATLAILKKVLMKK